ncbi:MAG: amino acid carrier protein [Oscillospiraceae bacterium]|nr:amino acid carrier protein [Oscillospiraceae bacterium]
MLDKISSYVWSSWMLGFILCFGIYISVRSGFFQITGFRTIFKSTFGSLLQKKDNRQSKDISQFRVFCTTLAATMGTGNIVGVASAIILGGAGAVFWMWISAFIGMMVVYAENYYGNVHRTRDRDGTWCGGAMNYIKAAFSNRTVPAVYACLCVAAAFGMGNMVQTNSISSSITSQFRADPLIIGAVAAFICGLAIIGGIKRISAMTSVIIPVISVFYISASLIIVIKNAGIIPDIFKKIFTEAFGIQAVSGGICGAVIKSAVSTGLRRGIFSNEAGLGTSAMIHTSGESSDPRIQGMWGIAEVFCDTIICCTATALVILSYICRGGNMDSDAAVLVISSFGSQFGKLTGIFICISVSVFAFATLIGWSHCGESAFRYLSRGKYIYLYRFFYCLAAAAGAVLKLSTVWTLSDIFNGLMIIPNICALFVLSLKEPFTCPCKKH